MHVVKSQFPAKTVVVALILSALINTVHSTQRLRGRGLTRGRGRGSNRSKTLGGLDRIGAEKIPIDGAHVDYTRTWRDIRALEDETNGNDNDDGDDYDYDDNGYEKYVHEQDELLQNLADEKEKTEQLNGFNREKDYYDDDNDDNDDNDDDSEAKVQMEALEKENESQPNEQQNILAEDDDYFVDDDDNNEDNGNDSNDDDGFADANIDYGDKDDDNDGTDDGFSADDDQDDDGSEKGIVDDDTSTEEEEEEGTNPPTDEPTNVPTLAPTSKSVVSVTLTSRPTAAPISSPTISPTKSPTVSPTVYPTSSPTLSPIASTTKSSSTAPIAVAKNFEDGLNTVQELEEKKSSENDDNESHSGAEQDDDTVDNNGDENGNGDDGQNPPSSSSTNESSPPSPPPQYTKEEDPSEIYENLPEEEKEYIDHIEMIDEEKTAAKISIGFIFLTLALMICTAQQMGENPDGVYANICRLAITVTSCVFKMILFPFRKVFGFGSGGYAHHLVTTQEFRDPYSTSSRSDRMQFL